jgi:hypothetical protein
MQRYIGILLVLLCGSLYVHGQSLPTITPFTGCGTCELYDLAYPTDNSMLLLTTGAKLYLSQDEGQNWSKLADAVAAIFTYPNQTNYLLLPNLNLNDFLTSTDGGVTTQSHNFPKNIRAYQIVMHSTNPGWFLIEYLEPGTVTRGSIAYTKDFGLTFQTPVNMKNITAAGNQILYGTPSQPDTIFFLRYDATFGYFKSYNSFVTLFTKSVGYVVTDNFLFVGQQRQSGIVLYSSANRDDDTHTVLNQYLIAEFPFGEDLAEYGYTFLDDSTRSEFIGVVRSDSKNWGTIFSSDFDGDIYTFVLNYTAQRSLNYDFDKFNGLAGIYFANAYPNSTGVGKQTKMTFDNGGSWRLLNAPTTDINGNPTNCQISQGCSLHLHGLTSWMGVNATPPFYTSPNAIGLMVAVGNLGSSVSYDQNQLNTYFTRDAGLTWTTLFAGPTIYEFGDHGGILVWSQINILTNRIFYSFDEGKTVQNTIFSPDQALLVDNIIIEPSGTGQKFVLLAHNSTKKFIFGLDFSNVINNPCGDSDYENWSPSDGEHGTNLCFMGATTVYQRRKQDSACYNNRDTDHILSQTPCPCAWEDYECDIGYSPSDRNNTDGFSCFVDGDIQPCSTGYRLVPDTLCTLDKGLNINSYPCPSAHRSHNGALVAVILLLVFIFVGAGAVGFLYWKNENFREFVLSKLSRFGLGSQRGPEYARVNVEENDEDDG